MGWLKTVFTELFAVFVDDRGFAIAIVLWVVLAGVILPRTGLSGEGSALLLFAGLAAILIESAVRRSRRSRRP